MARAGAQHELAPRWLRAPGEFETRTLTLALTLALALALALALTPALQPHALNPHNVDKAGRPMYFDRIGTLNIKKIHEVRSTHPHLNP